MLILLDKRLRPAQRFKIIFGLFLGKLIEFRVACYKSGFSSIGYPDILKKSLIGFYGLIVV